MRTWLQNTLTTHPGLSALVGDRVFQGGSLSSSLTPKPYVVVILGNDTSEGLGEDVDLHRQFFTLYVHDEPGDYSRIDDIVTQLKHALVNAFNKEAGVITVRYLETSRDLDDETLNTILRYIRFQAIRSTA